MSAQEARSGQGSNAGEAKELAELRETSGKRIFN